MAPAGRCVVSGNAFHEHVLFIREALDAWQDSWSALPADASVPSDPLAVDTDAVAAALGELMERLGDNYPFFHPRYAGQMLKPPHPVAVLGYLAAMHINPNNHALDGGPATARMEQEVVADIARRVAGWSRHLGHLTSGGTVANLEALWVARRERPGRAIAASRDAHYTHARMCEVLGVPFVTIESDDAGRMRVDALRDQLEAGRVGSAGRIGTVVATLGTTALGALDPVHEIAALCRERDVRLHVDAAYGGFYALIADDAPDGVASAPFRAASLADSLVVDPHKHGLQPYGCGAVLFSNPAVHRHYRHDSPYNYFTSDDLHLGEISLECSRPGAAAAALWLTLRCLPLEAHRGLGAGLRACRRAARAFADRIHGPDRGDRGDTVAAGDPGAGTGGFHLVADPELDIVAYAPAVEPFTSATVSAASERVFAAAMASPDDPVYLSTLRVPSRILAARYTHFVAEAPETVVLRSCLMKPEHEAVAAALVDRVARHADVALDSG